MKPDTLRSTVPGLAAALALAAVSPAQVTTRASRASDGTQFAEISEGGSISADGRRVAFGKGHFIDDTHSVFDSFVHDRALGTTDLVSVSLGGGPGNANSGGGLISADGRFVAFGSGASDLVPGDTNGKTDVFVRDLQTGTTERVSLAASGAEANDHVWLASMSSDARFVAFSTYASNLVAGDTNAESDVFVRDRLTGSTERVSLSSTGLQGNGGSTSGSLSPDGRWVVFASSASNLVPGDSNAIGIIDVFVRDRQLGTTEIVSVATDGTQTLSFCNAGSISGDGRFATFSTGSPNLVPGDTNGVFDVFVRDRTAGTTERVSVDAAGVQGNASSYVGAISQGSRFVVYTSYASNLVPGDTNGVEDVFVHDRLTGACERASVDSSGVQGNGPSFTASLSADDRYLVFWSWSTNLVAGDTNGYSDVFVRDRAASGFTSTCDPGTDGVSACPCSNPPVGRGRGCDNSAGTGGAVLSASGIAYLSMDTLVFTTSGERPSALSLVLQGDVEIATGTTYGQGVRCLGGTLKRLYVKVAVAGQISAPDLAAGDPPVAARSASLGDPIAPGTSRYYLVYYRDPLVLGGCPPTSTFNATQTGEVTWWL